MEELVQVRKQKSASMVEASFHHTFFLDLVGSIPIVAIYLIVNHYLQNLYVQYEKCMWVRDTKKKMIRLVYP